MIKLGDIVQSTDPGESQRHMRVISIVAGWATCFWTVAHMRGSMMAFLRDPASVEVSVKTARGVYLVDALKTDPRFTTLPYEDLL